MDRKVLISIKICIAIWLCAVWFAAVPAWADQGDETIATLEAAVRTSRQDGDAWVRLGQAYLDTGRLDNAEKAFQQGIRYAKSAAAHHGLGQVYMSNPKQVNQALYQLRRALAVDPSLVEAQVDIARVYVQTQNVDAESAMKKAVEIAPEYAPARLMLAKWYGDRGYSADAVEAYRAYLALRPDDAVGYEGLVMGYVGQRQYRAAAEMARSMSEQNPEEVRWFALAGQAYAARGDVDRALRLFEGYLSRIVPEERALYDDLSLVALRQEQKAFQDMTPEDREAFLERFWKQRDPLVVFGGKARLVEHYRRVWHARTFFSRGRQPWDRRGEIYIRYGEPDYRSVSYRENALPGPAARQIKERNAFALYESGGVQASQVVGLWEIPLDKDGDGAVDMETIARPSTGIRRPSSDDPVVRALDRSAQSEGTEGSQVRIHELPPGWIYFIRKSGGQVYLNKPPDVRYGRYIEPVFPLDRHMDGTPSVPWESWVYTNVGEGIEFVFVDPYGTENWEFPMVPAAVQRTGLAFRVSEYEPAVVHQRLASQTPEYFGAPPGMEPLAFVYDLASFRGDGGKAKLEVYFGIPLDHVALLESGDRRLLEVAWEVALVDSLGNDVARIREDRMFTGSALRVEKGTFVLDLASLDVAPGKYRLGVWLTDSASGKWGSYLQEVVVPAYGDSLGMSDLAMAWRVSREPGAEQFRKGDVWVIPMPNRGYEKTQGVYVYYEVYNLQRDAFNQTRYRVEYAIRQDIRVGGGMLHTMAGMLNKLFADQKPAVSVSYEREGSMSSEPMYLEVTPEKLKAGWNQILVTVTDLTSGRAVSRSAVFRLASEGDASVKAGPVQGW